MRPGDCRGPPMSPQRLPQDVRTTSTAPTRSNQDTPTPLENLPGRSNSWKYNKNQRFFNDFYIALGGPEERPRTSKDHTECSPRTPENLTGPPEGSLEPHGGSPSTPCGTPMTPRGHPEVPEEPPRSHRRSSQGPLRTPEDPQGPPRTTLENSPQALLHESDRAVNDNPLRLCSSWTAMSNFGLGN